ncbi:PEP-CTERM sorting domain-containing protein [Puniceicoccus vermicola]|uniref:PEP-CTERM sorting domain-containing protein n=1 Tax=Puniceicoccus vermicola TaxID=388746 RepID=A0A7X1AZT0_9BACT|nr:PEP-CTERM sorting domain-containing protein [Puniceicoccus vermicola]MBC2602927.1 PEP-CTERM sorting domain-containing protein [Puniceicoccus vermicola]
MKTIFRKSLPILPVLVFGFSSAHAQVFWNPAVDEYATQGGNGTWYADSGISGAVENWWNGSDNVYFTSGESAVFEGQGNVTATQLPVANGVTFRNLTGNYSINNSVRTDNGVTVEASAGEHDITFGGSLWVTGGEDTSIVHNGGGLLSISGFRRSSGNNTSVTISGSGHTAITGTASNDRTGGTLTKNGSGRLTVSANLNNSATPFSSIVMNAGELSFADDAEGTSLAWSGGSLVFSLSEMDDTSNTITLSGAFTKELGSSYIFDFQDTGKENTTYTLVTFASTDFAASDFTYTGSSAGGSFSVNGNSVQFTTIPEPSSGLLLILTLGMFTFSRRFSFPRSSKAPRRG